MLLAEANQWPEEAAAYFGQGDECHMCFHFPVMPRMFMSAAHGGSIPDHRHPRANADAAGKLSMGLCFCGTMTNSRWKWLTDEERDYMYRAYAHDPQMRINLGIRRRLSSLLGKDLESGRVDERAAAPRLPGTPVLYYGDEIGMGGQPSILAIGIASGRQCSGARSQCRFSRKQPAPALSADHHRSRFALRSFNVESQQNNQYSLLWWMKRLIAMRKRLQGIRTRNDRVSLPDNHRVLAFVRRYQTK
jgi:maltose alpha-D-glucosyltransferase/alpha-amylase